MTKTASQCTKYMKLALKLAEKGKGRVFPNPIVGCVIVKNGKVIGKGYHEYFGGPHAEINALKQAGAAAKGSEMYVNLEPCNHWGKTPPCTGAIISAGIKNVVIAMQDPNKRTGGEGIKKLIEHGIGVKTGILHKEALKLNKEYIAHLENPKSRVILKMAMTLDGKIATRTGDSKWISSAKARKYTHKLRTQVDAILIGVNTVIMDNPELSSHGEGRNPIRIIIDPGLKIPMASKVLDGKISTIILYNQASVKEKLEEIRRKGVLVVGVPVKNNRIDFKHIINILLKMSIYRVLIEGGGETAALAIEAGYVDEVLFVVSPKIIGGRDAKTPVEGEGIEKISKAIKLENIKVRRIGGDILLSGRVDNVYRNN